MSPTLQQQFVKQILPIIIAVVPKAIKPVGCEDREELVQDALAMACEGADSLEKRGKEIIARSVAYYVIQRLKSGRRFKQAGRTDVMSSGCRLHNCRVESLDAPVQQQGNDDGETLTLGDMIAARKDDPAQRAIRRLDWGKFTSGLDQRKQRVLTGTAAGFAVKELAAEVNVSPPRIVQLKREIAADARGYWGKSVLQDAGEKPAWRREQEQRR